MNFYFSALRGIKKTFMATSPAHAPLAAKQDETDPAEKLMLVSKVNYHSYKAKIRRSVLRDFHHSLNGLYPQMRIIEKRWKSGLAMIILDEANQPK